MAFLSLNSSLSFLAASLICWICASDSLLFGPESNMNCFNDALVARSVTFFTSNRRFVRSSSSFAASLFKVLQANWIFSTSCSCSFCRRFSSSSFCRCSSSCFRFSFSFLRFSSSCRLFSSCLIFSRCAFMEDTKSAKPFSGLEL